eukprot:m.486157 g.486157  ORF g.486157 m.486157 type:complete len:305 (+) comp24211_c0_seq1:141-1055(+)
MAENDFLKGLAVGVGVTVAGMTALRLLSGSATASDTDKFSVADQVARFTALKAAGKVITSHDGSKFKGKRVLVTGANRGLGLALVQELVACGAVVIAICRSASAELKSAGVAQIIEDVDVTNDAKVAAMAAKIKAPLDVVVNNAGYFKSERESVLANTIDAADEVTTIDVCAVGPLRVTQALWKANLLKPACKVAMITSQGGSIAWRDTQCPDGGDYGHHMSKAAANMMGKLLANELRDKVSVSLLHPGFNRTDMTSKYSHIWDEEGAVDPAIGAKRVLRQISAMNLKNSGRFVNCEDGKLIPW